MALKMWHLLQPKVLVDITADEFIGLDDVLDFSFHKVVERVDVLFDKSFDLQKCR